MPVLVHDDVLYRTFGVAGRLYGDRHFVPC